MNLPSHRTEYEWTLFPDDALEDQRDEIFTAIQSGGQPKTLASCSYATHTNKQTNKWKDK